MTEGLDLYSGFPPAQAYETVSQFIFVSFRSAARNLDFNKFSTLRLPQRLRGVSQ